MELPTARAGAAPLNIGDYFWGRGLAGFGCGRGWDDDSFRGVEEERGDAACLGCGGCVEEAGPRARLRGRCERGSADVGMLSGIGSDMVDCSPWVELWCDGC